MINLYNANTENEQINVLRSLFELLEEFDISPTKQPFMAGDFNLFFNSKLEGQGGNPTLNMIYVIYGGLEIRKLNGSLLHKNILQVSFNVGLTIY